MNDQRFFDLAMKVAAGQGTDAERAELAALVARDPGLKAEWENLQGDARVAREIAPLVAATQATGAEFPAYARERLQTKVRRTLGGAEASRAPGRWRWLFGLAGAAAAVVLFVVLSLRPAAPVIEVALLDMGGAVRGLETNEMGVFKQRWAKASVQVFDTAAELENWRVTAARSRRPVAKVIYDRAAGEVRVWVFGVGKPQSKAFPVERDLVATLREAEAFIREQTGR